MSQSDKQTEVSAPSKRSGKIKWIVGGLFLLFAAAAAMNLPRGYSDDLSRIGKGKAAVVLIRDKNAVQSFELIDVLDSVRAQYAGRVEFLLTDFDTPQGRAFIEANSAARATLVLLDANGKFVKVLKAPQTAGSVQQEIAVSFGVNP
ncbi:MAG: hypothetical protein HY938_04980 [Nitrosomonadales bacterium]|nr:hypothetical protein [Nitrosomonadales bacterium]